MLQRQINFKKQLLGQWRRDDGESKKEVNEESMFRELHKLANDGWSIEPHGVTHVRMIIATEPEQRKIEIREDSMIKERHPKL